MATKRTGGRGRASGGARALAVMGGAKVGRMSSMLGSQSGRWAAERFLAQLRETGTITSDALRTADLLSYDQWKAFDDVAIRESIANINGVQALISRGLTIPVPNALGKTVLQWQKVSDMNDAEVQLSGLARTEDDGLEFDTDGIPLPIIHKDFGLDIRVEAASRNSGPFGSNPLDTETAAVAGRKVGEKLEDMLYNGFDKKFGGLSIYGLLNHPNVNTGAIADWSAGATTGETILSDLIGMIGALQADGFYGPYMLHVTPAVSLKLDNDFKANSDLSIRARLLQVGGLLDIVRSDKLTDNTKVILHQASRDVVAIVQGEPVQTVQWDSYGGFRHEFKVWTIQVPLVRATRLGRSGIYIGT